MRLFICALLAVWSTARLSSGQTLPLPPPDAQGMAAATGAELQAQNTTAVLEERVRRLEAQLEAQNAAAQGPMAVAPANEQSAQAITVVDNSWRYRNHNGTWWYWLPSNRWVVWSNNAWVDYVPTTYASGSYIRPGYGTYGGFSGYGYRYSTGYRHAPHLGVGIYLGGGHGHGLSHYGGHGFSHHGGHGLNHHGGHGVGHGGHGEGHGGHGGGHGHH